MNFKKIPKWGILTSLLLTAMLVCGFTFSGAYTANVHNQTNSNAGTDTVSLKRKASEIIGFQKGEEAAEKTSVTAKLINPSVWGFTTDTDISSDEIENEEIENEQTADDSPSSNQMYDFYRTYEQTKEDIQNGYIVNTSASFSERMMPIVTGKESVRGTSFYVNHDNSIDISITLKNLIDGCGHNYWKPFTDESFLFFEVYDPSGKVAYSFYKEGKEIENEVDINTEIDVYPGEWQYKISFAYTTNGIDTSDMEFSLRYKTIFEDDIQWLVDNKLNKIN